jgi:hypothetical protein
MKVGNRSVGQQRFRSVIYAFGTTIAACEERGWTAAITKENMGRKSGAILKLL